MARNRVSKDHIDRLYDNNISPDTKTLYLGYGDDDEVDLDRKVVSETLKGLHLLSQIRPTDPIRILINCGGGDVLGGLAIYDYIRTLDCPVEIDVYGRCYSMAAWILQAGDTRRMSKHSSLMIHHGEGGVSGRPEDQKSWYKFYQGVDEVCVDILLRRMREVDEKFPRSKLERMLRVDTVLTAQQALELGLIDSIIGE